MSTSHALPFGVPVPASIRLGTLPVGVSRYRLPRLWQVHLYPYAVTAEIGGERLEIRPGCAGITPPGSAMWYDNRRVGVHTYAHFAPGDGLGIQAPLLVDLGPAYARTEADLREAVPWMATDPRRASIRLWDVLARVAAAAPGAPARDLAQRARERIEDLLPQPVVVADLAADLGVSREHLTRVFRARHGRSLVAYVRERRVALATHLLQATDKSITTIAQEVGAVDLHAFNKLIRKVTGQAPRDFRACRGTHLNA